MKSKIINALTFDVEDYFQVSAFGKVVSPEQWEAFPSRVRPNTEKILDLLDRSMTQATFFVLGWVAERHPEIVREIQNRGHEVACHGYSHQLVYSQSPEMFRKETERAKNILEDITGEPVKGYRAASYSITKSSLWALDMLIDLGFEYDSSIFPIRHDRYGIPEAPRLPHFIERSGGRLIEFPISTAKVLGIKIPVAGGGYFRLLPYLVTLYGLSRINRQEGLPFVFYLHPWEVDPAQPRIQANWLSKFRHYTNLEKCEARLTRLLRDFCFGRLEAVIEEWGSPFESVSYDVTPRTLGDHGTAG